MKTVLIVGKNFTGLKSKLIELDYKYIVLKDVKTVKNTNIKLKHTIYANFSNKQSLLKTVDEITSKGQHIDGVITIYENYVKHTAIIAAHLKLPGMPVDAATACTDKYIMRTLFSSARKKISPAFAEISNIKDLIEFADSHSFPLILKPTNLAKSLLVTKNNNLSELKHNYSNTIIKADSVYKKYAPNSQPKIIVEEFMEGPIFSVDAFVDKDGTPHVLANVVDYETGYDIGFDDNFHYSRTIPSKLPDSRIQQIREVAKIGCQALNMQSSPAHIEVILTKNGPMIVEIGARNGGYRDRMHGGANGIDIIGNAIKLCLDELPIIKPTTNYYCSVLELFPKTPGIFTEISNIDALKNLDSLVYFAIKQNIDEYVGKSSDGYKMCAIIILKHNNKKMFYDNLAYINKNIAVITK